MIYSLLRPLLFSLEPEKAHTLVARALRFLPQWCFPLPPLPPTPISCLGLSFPHRIGLAAGLDKNGTHIASLQKLGFSFIEVGTVTPRPQAGNPLPRLFRLPEVNALINRMGFNNEGVDALVLHVQKSEYQGILGINIGKNKDTPLEKAKEDYVFCLRKVYPFASYIAINISSPNTPQLRLLHQEEYLEDLLQHLQEVSLSLAEKEKRLVPLLVKISPDEEEETIKRIAASVQKKGFAGIIASNTTSTRKGLENVPFAQEEGGLSGRPLLSASTHCIRLVREVVGDSLAIIGVGGIDNLPRAQEKREAGADLLQVYTGLIYQGPRLISILLQGQSLW